MPKPLKTFICYAREDRDAVDDLRKHLRQAEKNQLLEIWDDGEILAGQDWDKAIKGRLKASQLILLFVSIDFINSDYIGTTELQAALQRHRDGEATLIPIIVRRCDWQEHFGIGQFQALPKGARPINSVELSIREEVYYEVAQGIKIVAQELKIKLDLNAEEDAKRQREKEEQERIERLHIIDAAVWKTVTELDTVEAYKIYLEKGYTLYAAEAQKCISRLEEAEATRQEKQRAKEKAEVLAAETRMAKEEGTERKTQVRSERQRIKDEAAWKAVIDLDSIEAYEDYLEKNYTLHTVEAHERISILEEAEAKRRATQRAKEKAEAERKAKEAEEKWQRGKVAKKKTDLFADLMVPITGGSFYMGSNEYSEEKPVHQVAVKDFHMCKYPVTQAQWKQIMGKYPPSVFKGDNLPVEQISWDDAQDFIKKLNAKTGKKYRLPSESEWEYAARGGEKSKGFKYAGSNNLDEVAWYSDNSRSKTHPVGQKKANELGLHDMSGNVWEWCQDMWHENYKGAPEDSSAWIAVDKQSRRVVRGGSWNYNKYYCRPTYRAGDGPDSRFHFIGFRVAR